MKTERLKSIYTISDGTFSVLFVLSLVSVVHSQYAAQTTQPAYKSPISSPLTPRQASHTLWHRPLQLNKQFDTNYTTASGGNRMMRGKGGGREEPAGREDSSSRVSQSGDDEVIVLYSPLVSGYVRNLFIGLYSAVSIITVSGNLLVIFVILRYRRMRTVINCFLANLALSDLLVGIFCVLPNLSAYLSPYWNLGQIMCKMYYFVQNVCYTASIIVMTVISLERYAAIVHPVLNRRLTCMWLRNVTSLIIWLVAILCGVPLAIVYDIVKIEDYDGVGSVTETTLFCVRVLHLNMTLYVTINFVLWYCVPLVIITIVYSRISCKLWRASHYGTGFGDKCIASTSTTTSESKATLLGACGKLQNCPSRNENLSRSFVLPFNASVSANASSDASSNGFSVQRTSLCKPPPKAYGCSSRDTKLGPANGKQGKHRQQNRRKSAKMLFSRHSSKNKQTQSADQQKDGLVLSDENDSDQSLIKSPIRRHEQTSSVSISSSVTRATSLPVTKCEYTSITASIRDERRISRIAINVNVNSSLSASNHKRGYQPARLKRVDGSVRCKAGRKQYRHQKTAKHQSGVIAQISVAPKLAQHSDTEGAGSVAMVMLKRVPPCPLNLDRHMSSSCSRLVTSQVTSPLSKLDAMRSRRRAIKMLIAIVASFALCSMPYQLYAMHLTWEQHDAQYESVDNGPSAREERGSSSSLLGASMSRLDMLLPPITFLALYFKSCLNPLLYALLSENFRKCLRELWVTCRQCSPLRYTRRI